MSVRRGASRTTKRRPRPNRGIRRAISLQEFLEHVEDVILEDFLMRCPDADWGRRVFKAWLDDVRWENRQRFAVSIRKRVIKAIDEGAETLSEIRTATGFLTPQIERCVAKLVKDGLYTWIRSGGETDVARGSRKMILHKTGEPCYA